MLALLRQRSPCFSLHWVQATQNMKTFTGRSVSRAAYLREILCVDDLLRTKPAGASIDFLQALVGNPEASPLYHSPVWQDANEGEPACSNVLCGQKSKDLLGGRCWDCFVRPPPPNADVQPQLTSVGCKKCGVHLAQTSADAYEGHCWKCFAFACKGCAGAISKTSFENLGGMCWKCYLKQADLQCVMPCKNLCAAHVACPNPRPAISGSSYCDQCREKHMQRETWGTLP